MLRDQEWLSERIWDIMHAKKVSLRGLYLKAKMGSATQLSRFLDGSKYMTPSAVANIANGLGISVERLERTDLPAGAEHLPSLLKKGTVTIHTLKVAQTMADLAVGAMEKADAYRDLGWTLYHLHRLEEAGQAWKRAYEWASTKNARQNSELLDENRAFRSGLDLTVFYTEMREFSMAIGLIDDLQSLCSDHPDKVGILHHQRGLCLVKLGEREAARGHYLVSQDCFQESGNRTRLGRIQLNLADLYFQEHRYEESVELLLLAKENLVDDTLTMRAIVVKDLARILICQGKREEALAVINDQLTVLEAAESKRDEVFAKLLLMKSDLTQDPAFAARIFLLRNISKELKCNSADLLTVIYLKQGENDLAFKYYEIMKQNLASSVADYKEGEWF